MARSRWLPYQLKRFAQVDGRRRLKVAEAVLCLLAARMVLSFVSFPRLAGWLGTLVAPSDPRVARNLQTDAPEQIDLAREIGWAVSRSAKWVPFRAVCLPQAMAAQFMLRRRGVASVMHFGAGRGKDRPLEAHAWLDASGVEVTGYPVPPAFAEVACFV